MPTPSNSKTIKVHDLQIDDPATICSPVEVFQSLSAKKQDELVSDFIMQRAQRGDVRAARYLKNHPRLRVMVFWVRGYRLNEEDEKDYGRRAQYVQINFSIGLCRPDDPTDWEDNSLQYDLEIDADIDNRISWKSWGNMYGSEAHDKLLPIFLGEWIKQPRRLMPQKPNADTYLIKDDTEMKLGQFIQRLQRWKHWQDNAPSLSHEN